MMYHQGQSAMTSSRGPHQVSSAQNAMTAGPTADPVLINRPILFSSGQFFGERIRYELKEIQKACLGRKYARVDRRPLDPPPVVLVKIWKYSTETGKEEEVNYEEVQTHGLLCTVDLFPVPSKTFKDSPTSPTSIPRTPKTVETSDGFVHFNPSGPSPTPSLTPSPSYRPQSYGPSDIVHYYEGIYPLLERSKNTHSLVGATFVQPVLVELFGKKCIVFVFSDLAVKSEGTFTLRYRIFDLFSPNSDLRGSSQSPSGTYPTTPSSLSISPTPSHVAPSPPSPTSPAGFVSPSSSFSQSTSFTHPPQSHSPPPLRSHFQLQPYEHSQQAAMNPYPDPSQDFIAPPPILQQPRKRLHEFDDHMDQHAQFAPYESQTRIEPRERDASLSILSECWARGAFRIFSTKEFPGLPASTDLTKQLARWGVRLNIRETERRRRRRSTIDEPEEEYHSDGGPGNEKEGASATKDLRLPPHKATVTNIKPRPPLSQAQQHYRASSSTSPPQSSPQQRRFSAPSPSSSLAHGRHRPRQHSEGDEYNEEPDLDHAPSEHGVEAMDRGKHPGYNPTSRTRNTSRPSLNTGLPAYYSFNPAGPFDPALQAGPSEGHLEYDVSSVTPQTHIHAPFAQSGLRSSINGASVYEDAQSVPTSIVGLYRHGSHSGRKRDSDGSSDTSRCSGGSVGDLPGMASSFMYGVGRGMNSGQGSQT